MKPRGLSDWLSLAVLALSLIGGYVSLNREMARIDERTQTLTEEVHSLRANLHGLELLLIDRFHQEGQK